MPSLRRHRPAARNPPLPTAECVDVLAYIARRLLLIIPTLFGILVINFIIALEGIFPSQT